MGSLKAKRPDPGHQGAPRGDDPPRLGITSEGMAAIGVEPEDEAPAGADAARHGRRRPGGRRPGAAEADGAATPAKRRPSARPRPKAAKAGSEAAPAGKPTPRAGTKQALHDRDAQAPRGRHRRADRRRHRLAAPHHPRRHLRRAQEEARAHRRGHPHPRGRPQQDRRQGQQHRLPDHRVGSGRSRRHD